MIKSERKAQAMDTILYFLLSLCYLILFGLGLFMAKRYHWKVENVLLVVMAALFYDNGMLAVGKFIGENESLKMLNAARYWMHAFFTPLLILYGWRLLVAANFDWAAKKLTVWIAAALTVSVIIIEIVTEAWGLSLKPVWKHGILFYEKSAVSSNLPFMIIAVCTVLLLTSLLIGWKKKQPLLLIGIVLAVGIGYAIDKILETGASHNVSELVLMISLFVSRLKLNRESSVTHQ